MEERLITNEVAEYILRAFVECLFPGISLSGDNALKFTLNIRDTKAIPKGIHFRYSVELDSKEIGDALMHFYPDSDKNITIVYVPSIHPYNLMELVYEVSSINYLIFKRTLIHTPEVEETYQANEWQIEEFNQLINKVKKDDSTRV